MENNPDVVSMPMLMKLQKEFKTLKKMNEEEMSMLRAKNAYIKQKLNEESVLNITSLETIEPRRRIHQNIEASFERTQRRQQERSSTFFGTSIRK